MLTNNDITIFHKVYDEVNRMDKWERQNYDNVWVHVVKGSKQNKGYHNNHQINVRIPYETLEISLNDIIVIGHTNIDLKVQEDLQESYNVTSITKNNFGNNPHTHIQGK